MDWQLCHDSMGGCNGLTPAMIDDMTLSEIALLAGNAQQQSMVWTDAMCDAEWERQYSMTPLEKIDAMLAGEM